MRPSRLRRSALERGSSTAALDAVIVLASSLFLLDGRRPARLPAFYCQPREQDRAFCRVAPRRKAIAIPRVSVRVFGFSINHGRRNKANQLPVYNYCHQTLSSGFAHFECVVSKARKGVACGFSARSVPDLPAWAASGPYQPARLRNSMIWARAFFASLLFKLHFLKSGRRPLRSQN